MKLRTIACPIGIALAALYVGASIQLESRTIRKARRSPSHGVIEMGSIPERTVIDGCLRFLGPSDVLAILYKEPDPDQNVSPTLIYYRLSYLAYPTRIEAATIGEEGIPSALAHLRQEPGWVLLLGQETSIPGYKEVTRFSSNKLLLRATGEPR